MKRSKTKKASPLIVYGKATADKAHDVIVQAYKQGGPGILCYRINRKSDRKRFETMYDEIRLAGGLEQWIEKQRIEGLKNRLREAFKGSKTKKKQIKPQSMEAQYRARRTICNCSYPEINPQNLRCRRCGLCASLESALMFLNEIIGSKRRNSQ